MWLAIVSSRNRCSSRPAPARRIEGLAWQRAGSEAIRHNFSDTGTRVSRSANTSSAKVVSVLISCLPLIFTPTDRTSSAYLQLCVQLRHHCIGGECRKDSNINAEIIRDPPHE